jgi:glycerol-3-phosphate acyltransferase PlsY
VNQALLTTGLTLVSYLIGSVPWGFVLGKTLKGVDVRQYGSGKTGSANVTRSLGPRIGVAVMLLDMSKGAVAILIARALGGGVFAETLAGIAAFLGHNWSIFIKFGGGRGVSTGVGGLFAISPLGGLVASVFAFGTMAATRYVSIGSMVGAVAGAVAMVVLSANGRLHSGYLPYMVIAPLIVLRHADNIGRLLKGQERKLGQKAERRAEGDRPPMSETRSKPPQQAGR